MKNLSKLHIILVALLALLTIAGMAAYKFWPRIYYNHFMPEYESNEARAEASLKYCKDKLCALTIVCL